MGVSKRLCPSLVLVLSAEQSRELKGSLPTRQGAGAWPTAQLRSPGQAKPPYLSLLAIRGKIKGRYGRSHKVKGKEDIHSPQP